MAHYNLDLEASIIYTTCSDGAWSNSWGSGTCSHHGGVAGYYPIVDETPTRPIERVEDDSKNQSDDNSGWWIGISIFLGVFFILWSVIVTIKDAKK